CAERADGDAWPPDGAQGRGLTAYAPPAKSPATSLRSAGPFSPCRDRQYIRGRSGRRCFRRSADRLQVICRHLAAPAIGHELELDLLAFAERAHAGALDSADMNERILAAIVRLDETEALLGVEPFNGSRRHGRPFHFT